MQTVVETTATTSRDGFAIVFTFNDVMPPSRSLFYLRFVFLVVSARLSSRHAINKLDNSPQHRDILCNAKQLNVQLEHLMFCKDVCTLYHATFRRAISRNLSTLRWAISRNATPFVCTLYLFAITLTHVTKRYTGILSLFVIAHCFSWWY